MALSCFYIERPEIGGSSTETTPPSPPTPVDGLPLPLRDTASNFVGHWRAKMQYSDGSDESEDLVLGPNIFDKPSVDVRDRVRSLMPPYMEAARLCRLAVRHSFWM